MTAAHHTQAMLAFWTEIGVDKLDLAVRRADEAMIWHRCVQQPDLPLAWARAENVRGGEIYVRPARGLSWPVVLLDDVDCVLARRIVGKYSALAVQTSPPGGCHVWIRTTDPLAEDQRRCAQAWLAARCDADPASTSGQHLGRLAGFKNWKREGVWVNVTAVSRDRPAWDPAMADLKRQADDTDPCGRRSSGAGLDGSSASNPTDALGCASPACTLSEQSCRSTRRKGVDRTPSGRDWAWVCRMLEAGVAPGQMYNELVLRARPRRAADAQRYATLTLERAQLHVSAKRHMPSNGGMSG